MAPIRRQYQYKIVRAAALAWVGHTKWINEAPRP